MSVPLERCMALVGIAQAARFVDMTASGQAFSDQERDATLYGVSVTDPGDVSAVFPDVAQFRCGWSTAKSMLARPDANIAPTLRYGLNLMELAHRLSGNRQVVQTLGAELARLAQLESAWTRTDLLAQVYQDTISTLGMRIQVTGDPALLQTAGVADQIRALLLAGIRYAWLWRQLGGRRWHLALRRSSIRQDLERLSGLFD